MRSTILLLVVAAAAVAAAQEPISIGIVRQDGYLIPLASIRGSDVIATTQVLRAYRGVAWSFYPSDGSSISEIKSTRPTAMPSHCQDQQVWQTTLDMPAWDEHVAPVPKIGIAVRGGEFQRIENVVQPPDDRSRQVAQFALTLAQAKQRERFIREGDPHFKKLTPAQREATPFKLETLVRHALASSTTYYFEASRDLSALGHGDLYRSRGWIVDSPAGLRGHGVTFQFDDDAAKENDRSTVHGVIRIGERSFWILETHGYEWEYYTLREWPSGIQRLSIGGGGC